MRAKRIYIGTRNNRVSIRSRSKEVMDSCFLTLFALVTRNYNRKIDVIYSSTLLNEYNYAKIISDSYWLRGEKIYVRTFKMG